VARVGLHVDLPRAAEPVEVVDVRRTELHLQGLEQVFHFHADRRGLVAIDVE
jgi:hypothetical protein